ncbi:hypothetical protein DPEC_G00344450 [Dallia pectoralis]|uniref:Uncharacterized protein n=1 Tax=Dallia pectoralis TaxID=75939 RepID=A0ACC2F3A2_DALPE|nr:hypothetical protein DPEC_G00344450 [Dallia pectoralis]
MVAYVCFASKVYSHQPCPVICFSSSENETCGLRIFFGASSQNLRKTGKNLNCNESVVYKPDSNRRACNCIYHILIGTRNYTIQGEIGNINQCNVDQTEVTFLFTWNTVCKLPQMLNRSSDCAINIMKPNDQNCRTRPLKNCVDKCTFIMNIKETNNQISTVITKINITTDPLSFNQSIPECNEQKLKKKGAKVNRTCTGQTERRHLTFIKSMFNNMIRDRPREIKCHCIKGSVTYLPNSSLNFKMALPSTKNAMTEDDDIWLEIPTEALRAFPVDTSNQVNLGVFWFEHDTLLPNNTKLLNNRVVAIEVGEDISGLSHAIKMSFLFQNASLVNETLTCVFWDFKNDTVAHWNTSGCVTETYTNGTLCSCNHLSFFAVLLTPGNILAASFPVAQMTTFSVWLLTLLSRVGCGISVCFLSLAVVIHMRRGKSMDSINVHIHMCISLLCLNLTFLINDSLASLGIHWLCVVTAAATHYSLLCTLTWFVLEGFHLWLLIIRVFNIHFHRYLLKLGLVGWGVPGFIVIIIAACGKYGEYIIQLNDGGVVQMCWLTDYVLTIVSYSYFVLTFLGKEYEFEDGGQSAGSGLATGDLLGGSPLPIWALGRNSLLHLLHRQFSPWVLSISTLLGFNSTRESNCLNVNHCSFFNTNASRHWDPIHQIYNISSHTVLFNVISPNHLKEVQQRRSQGFCEHGFAADWPIELVTK